MQNEIIKAITGFCPISVGQMLMLHPYERLVPYNLWFYHNSYRIVNEGCLRIRKWDNHILTPVYLKNGTFDVETRSGTVYQPFYPEQFYQIWDILQEKKISGSKYLTISREICLGSIEAVMMFHERYSDVDPSFHSRLIGDLSFDHLSNAFPIRYDQLDSSYDLIIIDTISKQDSLTKWEKEESDMKALRKQYERCVTRLKSDGVMIVKINLLGDGEFVKEICRSFEECEIVKPVMTHPFCGWVYLYAKGYQESERDEDLFGEAQKSWLEILKKMGKTRKTDKTEKWIRSHDLESVEQLLKSHHSYNDLHKSVNHSVHSCKGSVIDENVPKIDDSLIEAKLRLNHYKRVMDSKPKGDSRYLTWEDVSNQLSMSQRIKSKMKKNYQIRHCSNAWLKAYEMLTSFPKLIGRKTMVKVFHICEAPGAFIQAFDHFLEGKKVGYDWYAQTLNTSEDGALADHYNIIANNPDRWLVGPKDGDITEPESIQYYHDNLKGIDIITADGGISCPQNQFNNYETLASGILLGQVVCILSCLRESGSAILKMFLPMCNALTVSLVQILSSQFDRVYLHKPVSSHDCSSEVYLILIGYKTMDPNQLQILYDLMTRQCDPDIALVILDKKFMHSYQDSVSTLIERQIQSLRLHYCIYYDQDSVQKMNRLAWKASDNWLFKNRV